MINDVEETRLKLALDSIKMGKFTIGEAELIFNVKIPSGKYKTKDMGFHTPTKKGMMPDFYGWAEYFVDRTKFFTFDGGSYIYDNDCKKYRRISEAELDYILTQDTLRQVHPTQRNGFIRTLKSYSYKTPQIMKIPTGLLNLRNGVLDVRTGVLSPHNSNLFFTYCLPHAYDATARCDRWMKFLDDVFEGSSELKIISAMIFGYVLMGGHPWLHQAFVLYGEGRNGKSTFLEMLKQLIGQENFCSVSLSKLDKAFSVVHLDNKLANVIEESPNDRINAEAFKTAIGGGQLMGSKKYENEYLFDCHARFVFACNELPKFGEQTVGLQERLYFIPFKKYFEPSVRNGNILVELSAELPGILNWALSGLSLLLDERRIPVVQSSVDVLDQFKTESDSVYSWAEEFLTFDQNSKTEISSRALYKMYVEDTRDSNRQCVSDQKFFKRLRKFLNEKYKYPDDFINTKTRAYTGLSRSNGSSIFVNAQHNFNTPYKD